MADDSTTTDATDHHTTPTRPLTGEEYLERPARWARDLALR